MHIIVCMFDLSTHQLSPHLENYCETCTYIIPRRLVIDYRAPGNEANT